MRDLRYRIWDVETGKETAKLMGHSDYVGSIAISSDDKTVVSGSYDKTIRSWHKTRVDREG